MYEEIIIDNNVNGNLNEKNVCNNSDINFVKVSHNSVLNCLFLLSNDHKLIVYDLNTNKVLKNLDWNLKQQDGLSSSEALDIINIQDKCIVIGDHTVCSRFSNEGMFLLDTVFQTPSPANSTTTSKTLELNINDAINLLNSFKSIELDCINGLDEFILNLEKQINDITSLSSLSSFNQSKPQSWTTIKLTENYANFVLLLTQSLDEIKRNNLQCIAIPIISLMLDRLYRLDQAFLDSQFSNGQYQAAAASLGSSSVATAIAAAVNGVNNSGNGPVSGGGGVVGGNGPGTSYIGGMMGSASSILNPYSTFDKRYMCSEANRRATFYEWPHMDYKWVVPDALAQAGFYHQPSHQGDDRTICFVCDLCLVAWEQQDQPWSEHERHSPICQFVRGDITENVPLALTASNQAAHPVYVNSNSEDRIVCTSESSSERYFAVSNSTGHIIVYDSKDILKEMMHIQLINESAYNKHHKIKIHSLCFYYRNHKHVLYGSFTINDEVFIFSFNIFDIYRSYHSKSNKKSSKTHKSSSSQSKSGSSSSKANANNTNSPLILNQQKQQTFSQPQLQTTPITTTKPTSKDLDIKPTTDNINTSQSTLSDSSKKVKPENSQNIANNKLPGDFEFSAYMNNLVNNKIADGESNNNTVDNLDTPTESTNKTVELQTIESKTDSNSEKEEKQSETENNVDSTPTTNQEINNLAKQTPDSIASATLTPTVNQKNSVNNMISNLQANESKKISFNTNSANNIVFDLFSLQQQQSFNVHKNILSGGTSSFHAKNAINALNLSNFLNVRFEIGTNQESTSKSKSKYKKSIKILSVSCRPLNSTDSNADIQLKTFEFTEKCLSFRLASIDLSSEPRKNFDIKLINLYEKYLCALVNFTTENNQKSYKMYRIKHEENLTNSSTPGSNSSSSNDSKSKDKQQQPQITQTSSPIPLPLQSVSTPTNPQDQNNLTVPNSCLSATSSSRLNLTEFLLTSLPSSSLNSKIVSMLPISITTYDNDETNDLKYIAILNDLGVISIIDPNKYCKIVEFDSNPSDKFIYMAYCYGIDKICTVTQTGKINLISTRIHPIVVQPLLDELSGLINFSDVNLNKKFLACGVLDTNNINALHSLISFDTAKQNFSAKFPINWTPILSEQNQQRRHPQHILAESINLTKHWKNLNVNSNSTKTPTNNYLSFKANSKNDELNIELYLNKPVQIGCIQVKLKFNKEIDCPFELTLFKPNSSQNQSFKPKNIDSFVDFNLITDNKDALFGPVDVREFLDLTCTKTYKITICSNSLFKCRSNLYFLNLKLKNNKKSPSSDDFNSKLLSSNINFLQKVQITIRKYKKLGTIKNENIERSYMLSQFDFFKNLLNLISSSSYAQTSDTNMHLKLLDILNWIFYNNFSNEEDSYMSSLKEEFIKHLDKYLLNYYLYGDRSTSRKATIMLNFLINRLNDSNKNFSELLLDKLLGLLNYLPVFESSASMNWFFMLMHQVMSCNLSKTYDYCIKILTLLSKGHKYNPLYALLKMRYNFSCLIFESRLFDVDLYLKFDLTNQKITQPSQFQQNFMPNGNNYNFSFGTVAMTANNNSNMSSNSTNNPNQMFNNGNPSTNNQAGLTGTNIMNTSGGLSKDYITLMPQSVGLIEVLPLEFKCLTSSNGTSIDKTTNKQDKSLYVLPDCFSQFGNETQANNVNDLACDSKIQIDTSIFNSIFNFSPLQFLTVERLEPISRHHVILDFGFSVAITDIMIPSCGELSSISVDIWTLKEQKDSKRLCVSTDINQNPILLNDLEPPAVCRFLKITYVAHSANIVKAKIPIGHFFGFPLIFLNEQSSVGEQKTDVTQIQPANQKNVIQSYLSYLEKLNEDKKCHYFMALGKLRELLNEISFPSDNIGHLKMMQFNYNDNNNESSLRLKEAYNQCLDHQFQYNLNSKLIKRLRSTLGLSDYDEMGTKKITTIDEVNVDLEKAVDEMSQDKLRVSNSLLIKTLLSLTYKISNDLKQQKQIIEIETKNLLFYDKINLDQACDLFANLCIYGNLEKECSLLLLRCCYNEPWWGEFISNCLRKFFVKQVKEVMSLNKVFITLNEICIKSLNGIQTEILFKSLFNLVEEILNPLEKEDRCVEVTSLEWIFLFISRLISIIDKSRDINCRWEFLENIYLNQKNLTKPFPLRAKSKVKKKLIQTNKYFTWSKIKENRKNLDRYRKSLWKTDSFPSNGQENLTKLMLNKKIFLPHDVSLRVGYLIGKLLVSANSYCSSDLFVLSCRILSSICCSTQPSISLSEIFEKNDLNQLILLNVSGEFNHGSVCWGSPWSQHALISLFMDSIENEKASIENQFNNLEKQDNQTPKAQNWPYNPQMSSFKIPSNNNNSENNNNLKKIEEIDEISIENKNIQPPSSVIDALKITGDIAKNFSQLSEMLSTQINELCQPTSSSSSNKQTITESILNNANSKIDDMPQPSTSSNDGTKANQKLLNDLVENIMNKKLEEIKHTLTKPIKKLNYLNSTSLSFNTSNINKKLAQLQNQVGAGLNFNSHNQHIHSSYNFSYDLRLETSFYQTLEHNLFIKVCNQNEIINNSLIDPLPQGFINIPTASDLNTSGPTSTSCLKSSIHLLQETIETIFEDLSKVNIENLLSFWLTLCSSEADMLKEPFLCLKESTADYLLDILINYSFMTVKLWYLSFKMLGFLIGYHKTLFSNKDTVYKFIYKFLSSNNELVGDECCNSLIDFLKKLSESSCYTNEQESHFKKNLFSILCNSIDNDGCIRRAQGPIDAQVTFVEYLISEDLVKCYEIESSNSDYENMVTNYFDYLAKIVQHHIYIYPRLSVKGVTSPRSCFSGVLTSLLFGTNSINNKNINDKMKSSFDLPVPSFSVYGSAPHGFNINSNNINSNIYSSSSQQASSSESNYNKQRLNMTNSSQSVLCNRDMLICLLLKFGINLISDMKLTNVMENFIPSDENKNIDVKSEQISETPTATNSTSATFANKNKCNENSEQENSEHFYEDDLLIQQLFLFELQNIEDNEACVDQISQENFSCDMDPEFESMPQQIGFVDSSFDEKQSESLENKDPNTSSDHICKQAVRTMSPLRKLANKNNLAETNLKQKSLIKLLSNECLEMLIESLALCQSSALAMVISNSGYPIELTLDDIQTPGDGLFLLLKSLTKEPLKLIEPLFSYLNKFKRLSEPLLWFCSSLFSHESVVKSFIERGGIEVISKGLSITTRQLLYSGPCVISSLMNFIDTERQNMKTVNSYDNDSTEGFTNFAPFGSIICTNPTGNPVDVLLQNSAPHRRIRSAIWSYNFQPNEQKVGLFLTFPYAFLLKEVQILPHTVSFGNCPAYVSLEVSRDGSFMIPIAPPVFTMGMSSIKLQLNKSELVNTVQINFYKSKDSHMIGLSQIRLLGYPMFENMLSAKPDMMLTPVEDLVSRSNMGWLRLLYTCLTTVPSLENYVSEKIQDTTMLLCTRLLSSPAMIIYDKIIETILIKLSKFSSQRSLEITKQLLRAEIGYKSGLYSIPHGILMETLVNILYQISENSFKDSDVESERIDSIIHWLSECFGHKYQESSLTTNYYHYPSNMILHCVACILYKSEYIPSIDERFMELLINYSLSINEYYTKQSIDWILCSLFYKKPELIETLTKMIELNAIGTKHKLQEKRSLSLIGSLSYAIQSSNVIEIFIKSDFFKNFVNFFMNRIENFSYDSHTIELNFIKVFLALAEFEHGQNWLGTDVGCNLWQKLLDLLCNSSRPTSISDSEEISLLVIQFIKKMIFCNNDNQLKFAVYIKKLIKNSNQNITTPKIITGFLHQLIIQVLLDDQTILVNLERKSSLFKTSCNSSLGLLTHPRFATGNNCRLVELPLTKTYSQIVQFISDVPLSQILSVAPTSTTSLSKSCENFNENVLEMKELLSKFKAFSDYNEPYPKKDKSNLANQINKLANPTIPKIKLFLKDFCGEEVSISNEYTLSKVLHLHLARSKQTMTNYLTISVHSTYTNEDEFMKMSNVDLNDIDDQLSTPLDAFVKCDGLIMLAECLPTLMPFIHEPLLNITDKDKLSSQSGDQIPKTSPDFVDYVIMNESDEPFPFDDMYNDIQGASTSSNQMSRFKKITMPPHAFIAFGLFLKIPGYATVMLRNRKQAQCILKLLLGSSRNKEEDFGLSLSTTPFISLRDLLNDVKVSTDTFLRSTTINFIFDNRILTLVLSILSSLSHHPHRKKNPHFEKQIIPESSMSLTFSDMPTITNDEKNNLYWAKGTGFGTGSTIQQWDAEKTLMQQKMEEEHVTCILEILSSYIECCDDLAESIVELLDHSCIINALSSYLRNDSVLDMSRHIGLYKAALKLLQSFVLCDKLRALIENCSIFELVTNMKQFVDSYTQRIKLNEEGGLSCLVPVLNDTYSALINYIKPVTDKDINQSILNNENQNIDKVYCDGLKSLQFDTYQIVTETDSNNIKANISYYYESTLNDMSNLNNANRAKRLAQETITLSNSLPLSFSSSVFVRCDEERLDVMKVLITGPQDTPYANGCFEFDVFFPSDYPDSPPMINLQTTGNQTVRFNPNLYHDGKVCLSILNTWHGRPEERWNGQTSSFLQVLVSIQSLILVSEPYFNEPGYERSRGTPAGTASSIEHDANIRQATVKWGMLEMIKKPSPCFKEVVQKHFYYKKKEIKEQCENWLKEMELHLNDKQIGQSLLKSSTALKRHMSQLFDELDKLEIPDNANSNSTE